MFRGPQPRGSGLSGQLSRGRSGLTTFPEMHEPKAVGIFAATRPIPSRRSPVDLPPRYRLGRRRPHRSVGLAATWIDEPTDNFRHPGRVEPGAHEPRRQSNDHVFGSLH